MRTGEVYSFQPASFIGTAKNTVAATIGSLDSFLDVRGFAAGEDSLAWILQAIKPYYVSMLDRMEDKPSGDITGG